MNRRSGANLYIVLFLACGTLKAQVPPSGGQNPPQGQPAAGPGNTSAPTFSGDPITQWLKSQVAPDKSETTTAQASQSKSTQTSAISLDHGSTSIVDQSSGADLVNAALSLSPVTSTMGSSGNNGSGTVTASLYSLYTLATHQDPLAPNVYNSSGSVRLRQLFFTIGHESENTSNTTTAATSNANFRALATAATNTNSGTNSSIAPSGVVYGSRYLFINRRDATAVHNDQCLQKGIIEVLDRDSQPYTNVFPSMLALLPSTLTSDPKATVDDVTNAIKALPSDKQAHIQDIVNDLKSQLKNRDQTGIALNISRCPSYNGKTLSDLIEEIQGRLQFALDFQSIQRTGTSPSDYRGELIFDQGYRQNDFHLTLNGSFDYSNSPIVGSDLRTGRGAMGLSYNITKVGAASLRSPLKLEFSGEGTRTEKRWGYREQLEISIPISAGVSLPASFGYANELTGLRQLEKGVYGKFGLAVDFSKLSALLQSKK